VVMPGVAHRQHRYLNNRAENSHSQRANERDACGGSSPPGTRNALSRCTGSSPHTSDLAVTFSLLPISSRLRSKRFQTWNEVTQAFALA
jgi:putative transposase